MTPKTPRCPAPVTQPSQQGYLATDAEGMESNCVMALPPGLLLHRQPSANHRVAETLSVAAVKEERARLRRGTQAYNALQGRTRAYRSQHFWCPFWCPRLCTLKHFAILYQKFASPELSDPKGGMGLLETQNPRSSHPAYWTEILYLVLNRPPGGGSLSSVRQ